MKKRSKRRKKGRLTRLSSLCRNRKSTLLLTLSVLGCLYLFSPYMCVRCLYVFYQRAVQAGQPLGGKQSRGSNLSSPRLKADALYKTESPTERYSVQKYTYALGNFNLNRFWAGVEKAPFPSCAAAGPLEKKIIVYSNMSTVFGERVYSGTRLTVSLRDQSLSNIIRHDLCTCIFIITHCSEVSPELYLTIDDAWRYRLR